MSRLQVLIIFSLTFLLHTISYAEELCVLEGQITDSQGRAIAGANVIVVNSTVGTYANNKGHYDLTLSRGKYQFTYSSLGYKDQTIELDLGASRVTQNIELEESELSLEQINVTSQQKGYNVKSTEMSVNTLNMEVISRMPQLMGEVDVIKTMQLMPGVHQSSEGSSGYSVRGGTADQNLILLDGGNIYNPSHLLGFFSVFNNDVVEQATMYRSGFPAQYGGRLSSILDVETKSYVDDSFSGSGGIGLISARLSLMGAADSTLFWNVAARRSYADLFLKLAPDASMRDMILNFYDFNGKFVYNFSDKNSLTFGGYYGRDNMGMDLLDFSYGNALAYGSWKHKFSDRLNSSLSFIWSRYDYDIESEMYISQTSWKSSISSPSLRYDMSYFISDNNQMNFGVSSFYHFLNPGEISLYSSSESKDIKTYNASENTIYVSDKHIFENGLSVTGVLRYNIFANYSASSAAVYNALDIRAGVMVPFSRDNSIKFNFERNNQFVQWANNSMSGSPLNIWFASSQNIKPQISEQYSVGYFQNLNNNMFELSAELYYKDFRNVIDFIDNADIFGDEDLETQVRSGKGHSYGLELMFSKNYGRWTGFVNYTYSHSEFQIDGINDGKSYLSPYDRPHVFNLSVNWQASEKWNLSMLWVYYTGNPASFPESYVQIGQDYIPVYSERNTYRVKDYHRMDLSATFTPHPEKTVRRGEWNVSIYNLYARKNTWMYQFSVDKVENYYLFGLIPSVSYNFVF